MDQDYKKNKEKLSKLLKKIENNIPVLETNINSKYKNDKISIGNVSNQNLQEALSKTINLMMDWEDSLVDVNDILDDCELGVETSFDLSYRNVKTNSNEDYNSSEAKIIAKCDDLYRSFKLAHLRLSKLQKICKSVLATLESRKYILKDITSLVIDGSTDYMIL